MLKAGLTLALAGLATSAVAATRLSTTDVSCAQAARIVARSGAVVLGTGGMTFDRFVADRSYCMPTEAVQASFATTADAPQCLVGYRCVEPSVNLNRSR